MKRWQIITVAVVVVAAFGLSVASGWIWNGHSKAEAEPTVTLTMPQVVAQSIFQKYGADIAITSWPVEVQNVYLVSWKDATKLHVTLWLDGLPIEVASAPLATPALAPSGG